MRSGIGIRMYAFVEKIKEIKGVIIKIKIFYLLLDSFSLFLFLSVVALLLGFSVFYALIPAAIFGILRFREKIDVFKELSRRYRYFEERLPAAYDNRKENNPIIRDLSSEISARLDMVRYASFLNHRRVLIRVVISVVLSFIIVSMGFADIEPIRTSINQLQPIERVNVTHENYPAGENIELELPVGERDIFGEAFIANIGGREVELELYQSGLGEIIRQVEEEREFPWVSGASTGVEKADTYVEDIPRKYEKIIKEYFEELVAEG